MESGVTHLVGVLELVYMLEMACILTSDVLAWWRRAWGREVGVTGI